MSVMQTMLFQELEKKMEHLLEKFDALKKENKEKEAALSAKDKDRFADRKRLEVLLKERQSIKQQIDTLVDKLDSSGLL